MSATNGDVLDLIREACDDLYCAPSDEQAQRRLLEILQQADVDSGDDSRRRARLIRIACDELHDAPDDRDARHALLLLLKDSTSL
ncbi:hypothetical protein DVS77_26630 [Mycolicibacterium moriokaense]|nr:hypothetical protein DVS77_26630 [Mycolicibacterium moriokaense]